MPEARHQSKLGTLLAHQRGLAKSLIGTSSQAPRPRGSAPPWLFSRSYYAYTTYPFENRGCHCRDDVENHSPQDRRLQDPSSLVYTPPWSTRNPRPPRAHRVSAVDGTLPDVPLVAPPRCPFFCLFDQARCPVLFSLLQLVCLVRQAPDSCNTLPVPLTLAQSRLS